MKQLVIEYDSDEPIYPYEKIRLLGLACDTLRMGLREFSKWGTLEPLHPDYPPNTKAKAFVARASVDEAPPKRKRTVGLQCFAPGLESITFCR